MFGTRNSNVKTLAALLATFFLWCVPANAGQLPLLGAGKPAAGGGGGSCAQSTAYLARTSGMSGGDQAAVDTAICCLVTAGNPWTKADFIHFYATNVAANGRLNVVSSNYAATVTGSPTFTADQGYAGAASALLNLNFNPTTATTPNYTQNDAGLFAWTLTAISSGVDYGYLASDNQAAGSAIALYPHFSDNKYYWNANQTTSSDNNGLTGPGHFYGFVRTGSGTTAASGYIDLVSSLGSIVSAAPVNANLVALNGGATAGPFNGNIAFDWGGGSLNGTEEAAAYACVHVYMQTVAGAP